LRHIRGNRNFNDFPGTYDITSNRTPAGTGDGSVVLHLRKKQAKNQLICCSASITFTYMKRYPHQLGGGQKQQSYMIAMAYELQ